MSELQLRKWGLSMDTCAPNSEVVYLSAASVLDHKVELRGYEESSD